MWSRLRTFEKRIQAGWTWEALSLQGRRGEVGRKSNADVGCPQIICGAAVGVGSIQKRVRERLAVVRASSSHASDGGEGVKAIASSLSSSVVVSAEERKRFDQYLNQLFESNAKFNLTAIKTKEEANERHIDDSLSLLPILDKCAQSLESAARVETEDCGELGGGFRGLKLIDVGTGAGLPGVIIAVKRPQWQITLLDSLQKRCNFLNQVREDLDLCNVTVHWARAEDTGRDEEHRGKYNLAMARAVAELRVLVELCMPMVEVGGFLVAAKGPNPEEEVEQAARALKELHAEVVSIEPVSSYGAHGQRTVVVIQKLKETPDKYPRQAGKPNKRPL